MEQKIVYFDRPGKENTEATFRIARQQAEELGIKTLVIASTDGGNALKAMEMLKGFRVVIVTHSTGYREPDTQEFPAEIRQQFEQWGGTVLTAAHAFAGVSRAMRSQFNTYVIGDIIASTLRLFGDGMKVACEIAIMAADGGLARTDEEVIAIAGTGRGADTAVVLKPVNSQRFFNLKVNKILCKPL